MCSLAPVYAVHAAAETLVARLREAAWPAEGRAAIGPRLAADDFFFKRDWGNTDPTQNQLERNIVAPMPWILTSRHPFLTAACANTLAEFDRCYRSLSQSVAMRGKNLLFVAGVNIDISPYPGETFPMTKFAPWAAFVQQADGPREILEQDELIERLGRYSNENPSQLSLDKNIAMMTEHREVTVRL